MAEALDKHANIPNVETKGVKAHFAMDDSGLISITSVDSVFEKTITVEEQEAELKVKEAEEKSKNEAKEENSEKKEGEGDEKEESSWKHLGDTISSFFNKGRAT